ncbi:hypothetical protein BS78_06G111900 [Paspalum vaginatum]|nr:hypothetical protein BS78_06G111900 [Paspalum vaginatum]
MRRTSRAPPSYATPPPGATAGPARVGAELEKCRRSLVGEREGATVAAAAAELLPRRTAAHRRRRRDRPIWSAPTPVHAPTAAAEGWERDPCFCAEEDSAEQAAEWRGGGRRVSNCDPDPDPEIARPQRNDGAQRGAQCSSVVVAVLVDLAYFQLEPYFQLQKGAVRLSQVSVIHCQNSQRNLV